ncbi:2-amino-4-hydroxy-6-hydroxymethyldihydropteridine pyrophosphokinase [Rubripirellula obstinata]|uniref:2-amino-4-hydroxy-6-hydroxymethyldihydropteridine pyrophosphokinase n=2 Tax=Rubripirellula obstinata TaxID=406547 RepID=A0A5B1CN13_9BACT|nr:2-amino-4-hydroxy-6-hydroxymethyldihydropteridine pyrophosphokinase [Rubripirellula obstinata]
MIAADGCVNDFAASRLYETPPIGGPDGQEPFLNAVAAFETNVAAAKILSKLQSVEDKLGRLRKTRWGARSIDLDVVLHGELIGGSRGLVVPHPRYTARRFVLRPACDVAGHYRDPRFGWSLQKLADHLDQGVASMALAGGTEANRSELCDRLSHESGLTIFKSRPIAQPMSVIGNAPAPNQTSSSANRHPTIPLSTDTAWVSDFVPDLPDTESEPAKLPNTPRLIARLQATEPGNRWPAPHQMWPGGRNWPEYRLELDDMDWAAKEVVSAIQSMRCSLVPVSEDGNWWQ